LWLLLGRRPSSLVPVWAAWVIVVCCGWLLLAPLNKLIDEEYAEGVSSPAVGVLSQYFPLVIGQASGRVWLGSTDATAAFVGQLLNQVFVLWVVAMLIVAVLWLLRGRSPKPPGHDLSKARHG
jgi:phosphatidylserine synthase